jgi:hypothetical protein
MIGTWLFDRIALARAFGATDVVSERGDAAVERVRELTDGFGVHCVLECVGLEQSMLTALGIARPGGAVGRVGVPQHESIPAAMVLAGCSGCPSPGLFPDRSAGTEAETASGVGTRPVGSPTYTRSDRHTTSR